MTAKYSNWRTSSYTNPDGHCVEVATVDGTVAVRDTKDRLGPMLEFGRREWAEFIRTLRR